MRAARQLVVLLVLGVLLTGCGSGGKVSSGPKPSGKTVKTAAGTATPYGSDARRVWVLTPRDGRFSSVVVYLHGWGATSPFEWHVHWFDHLLERGSAVLFPVYQLGTGDDTPPVTLPDARAGIQLGFRALDAHDVPVVAAGFSHGAALAFFYASRAGSWGVPRPAAVYSVFPVDPLGIDPAFGRAPLRDTRVVVLAGDRDTTVGRAGADAFWAWLRTSPARLRTYRIVRTTDELLADHEAPTFVDSAAVRATFWQPLDVLVEAARR